MPGEEINRREGEVTVGETADAIQLRGHECQEALDTLYRFIDGELTEQRRRQIQDHLDDCPPCLDKFDFEAVLKVVIAQRCRETVPESLRLRIAISLQDASASFRRPEEGADTHPQPDHHR